MTKHSITIILETRTPLKKKKENDPELYPVKLRLTIERKSRYYNLGEYLTQKEFDNDVFAANPAKKYDKIAKRISDNKERAKQLLDKMETPNFDQFKRLFTFQGSGGNVKKYFDAYILELKQDNRHGTASNYDCSYNSLNTVKGLENANFRDINVTWLKDYTKKMKAKGKSISTIGIYLRPLRFLFNRALADGIISPANYPFGESKKGFFQIPASEGNKRPLERSEIEALANYTGNPLNERYRDLFLLSYFFVGLNFADLLTLKWDQLKGNVLEVVRKKTEGTTQSKQKKIQYFVNDEAQAIIERHGNPTGTYIFNIISDKDSPQEIRRKVQNFNRNTNQALKAIAKQLNDKAEKVILNPAISTVFARHSAASHGLAAGASLADISEALGHKNIQTTSNYISSMGNKQALGESLKIKAAVPKVEPGTNDPETQQQQGIEAVPASVPVERFLT